MNDGFERVANLKDIPDGEMISVHNSNGDDILLARVKDNVYALHNLCSHAEAWLDAGWLHADTLEVECPLHEGRFDLRTGAVTAEPPDEPVKAYAVRVEADEIFVGPQKR